MQMIMETIASPGTELASPTASDSALPWLAILFTLAEGVVCPQVRCCDP